MLGNTNVHPTIAVRDLSEAQTFYEGVLGLEKLDGNEGGTLYRSGDSKIMVYQAESAGSSKATSASWEVEDLEGVVQALGQKGVTFEHYEDMPGVTRVGDLHTMGEMSAAWFKDPSGNILCVSNGAL
jgi:catechol 2,3-dioxygenase-like lactoylglutathione lyase family enzyme